MADSFKVYYALTLLVTSIVATTALSLLTTTTATTTDVYAQMATLQNIKATYAISIVPGAAQMTSLLHYYPPAITVPIGTTIGWFNNDPEQPHTVTSGKPGASDSGAIFNSGIMPATANSFFQYTFNRAGDFVYHCEIHPWRVGIVSVSAATEKGNNFQLASGVGPTWNLTKDFRTLLDFTPITVPLDGSTPLTYNVTIFKNNTTNKVFTKTFTVNGDKLPLELIARGYINQTRVYGPDFSSTGAYHLEGVFFKGNANYTIRAEITAINGKPPQNKITDDFTLRTIA
jgi:plastocyanin